MWSKQQIKAFAAEVRTQYRGAWAHFGPEIHEAIVDAKVLTVIAMQARESVAIAAIDELRAALRAELLGAG